MLSLRSALRAAPRAARTFGTTAARLEKAPLELALRDGLKSAMKARDKGAVSALKAIIADVTYNVKSSDQPNEDASHEVVVTTIRKGIDKRVSGVWLAVMAQRVPRCMGSEAGRCTDPLPETSSRGVRAWHAGRPRRQLRHPQR